MMKKVFILTVVGLFFQLDIWAQGCSDAGFCTAGSMKSGSEDNMSDFTLAIPYAAGEQLTSILTIQPELNYKISDKQKVQVKLSYMIISGDLGAIQGLGDPIVTYSTLILEKKDWLFASNIGARIAVNNANKMANGMALPMPYQTSLGTYDLIAGVTLRNDKWNFALGYQQPLIHANHNAFMHTDSASAKEMNYFQSVNLRRKGDVMLRIERSHQWNKVKLSGGFLPIFHLGQDIIKPNNRLTKIEGSEGLTLNLNLNVAYKVKEKMLIGLIAATPLIVRENRPDGLTRAFVASPYFIYKL